MSSALFSSLRLRSVEIPNRIVVSPMCMYSASDGLPNAWHLVHLGSRAVGGAGLIIAEATAVSAGGRITPGDLGIWSDEQIEAFRPITAFIADQGSVPGVQLAHAGRKAGRTIPWEGNLPIPADAWGHLSAPSALPFEPEWQTPVAMDEAAMARVVDDFVMATHRAHEAGFRVVEAHFAHGYLAHSFLSPLTNHRTDDYGGSLANRTRFPLRIVRAMRAAWPADLPLFVRLSIVDWAEGGWTLEDTVTLAGWLKEAGADLIDCSSGANVPGEAIPATPGYHAGMTAHIRASAGIATGVVGLISDPGMAEDFIADGTADLVFLARAMLRNPYWPREAAEALGADNMLPIPIQYRRAIVRRRNRTQ